MSQPTNSTVTIAETKFNAMSVNVGIETHHDDFGLPMMGTLRTVITCSVDIHDTINMPFPKLKSLYDLANIVTRDKIVPMKIEFWKDDAAQDAICTYTFNGWISAFHTSGGGPGNHTLDMKLTPELDRQQFLKLTMAN